MITDAPPRAQARLREYARSDALLTLALPEAASVQALTRALAESMASGETAPVRRAGEALVSALAEFYEIPAPPLRVLGVRPHRVTAGVCTYQLFGDYLPSTQRIRVWMRTAIREKVSSPKALLNTLLHEFCHHLDFQLFHFPDSWHTRGFYERAAALYHHARGTPRKPLYWVRMGQERWRIDWQKTARGK